MEYEVEFLAGNVEYEYTLNAANGAVLGWEMGGYPYHCGMGHCTRPPMTFDHNHSHH